MVCSGAAASVPRRVKNRGNKTAAESPAANTFRLDGIGRHDRSLSHTVSMPESRVTLEITEYAPVVELADTMDLGSIPRG